VNPPPFSWLQTLSSLRRAIEQNPEDGIQALRRAVQSCPAQGFEIELIGRLLRSIVPAVDSTLPVYRVAVLASYTSDPVANAMCVALLREGYFPLIYEAPYGSYRQEILAPSEALTAFEPHAALIAVSVEEHLPTGVPPAISVEDWLDREVDDWSSLWNLLKQRFGVTVFQHVFELPEPEFLGLAERRASWTPVNLTGRLNRRLIDEAPGFVRWIDVESLATRVGRQHWRDVRLHHHGQFGFSTKFLPEYCQLMGAAVREATGQPKKALVVDLDNTLWGGVVGDDRVDGIRLGPETAEGAAFQEFCRYLKALAGRGVILAICSKNDLTNVVEVFDTHPHMPLRLSDFAAVVCNWNDKATNLKRIASDLNIDPSALVFADDNPAECMWVRQAIPAIHTVLMDGDPAGFVRKIDQQHLFDTAAYSSADLTRSQSYQARARLGALERAAPDLHTFLTSLAMVADVWRPVAQDLSRLAQMESKTNQFNLSTRRLTVDRLETMATDPERIIFAISLADKLADHGVVSYVAGHPTGETLQITDWLMSCRVFSRTLEHFVVNQLAAECRRRALHSIRACRVPTTKNGLLEGVLAGLGFVREVGSDNWELQVDDWNDRVTFVRRADSNVPPTQANDEASGSTGPVANS
jgi:FkbH-like protein